MARRPGMPPSVYSSRVMGGYVVMPTTTQLRGIRRTSERLAATVDAVEFAERYIRALNNLLEEDVIILRQANTKWSSLSRRTGIPVKTLIARIAGRLRAGRRWSATTDSLLAEDSTSVAA